MYEGKEEEGIFWELFSGIIKELNEIKDYSIISEKGALSGDANQSSGSKYNVFPYGTPTDECYKSLVVIIDGKYNMEDLLTKALMHVGISCKGITRYVLFYVAGYNKDKEAWDRVWDLFKPSFSFYANHHNLNYGVYYKHNKPVNTKSGRKKFGAKELL